MKRLLTIACILTMANLSMAQSKNTSVEVQDYKEKDGFIILELNVNGVAADFLLDLAGKTSILTDFVNPLGISEFVPFYPNEVNDKFIYKNIEADKKAFVQTMSFGNNVFVNKQEVLILPDKENKLRSLGVAGIVSGTIFRNCVLTIDANRKKITTSIPFRPSYMQLVNRSQMNILPGSAVELPVEIDGKTTNLLLDTWQQGLIVWPGTFQTPGQCILAGVTIPNPAVTENAQVAKPTVGLNILRYGILSVDYLHSKVYFQSFLETTIADEAAPQLAPVIPGKLNAISKNEFIAYIFDYKSEGDSVSNYDKPVVIDFWASWCGPCIKMLPQMEKMAEKYKDRVVFFKVNADKEKELCARFNILALPTLFFIPPGGSPIIETGALPAKYEDIIENQLLGK